jgi:hypothetical protein
MWNPADDPDKKHVQVENVIPVAGNFKTTSGGNLDPFWTRLKSSDSKADGLSLELNGGKYNKKPQRAVIQFICDPDRTGEEQGRQIRAAKDEDDKDDKDKDGDDDDDEEKPQTSSLTFVSYGPSGDKEDREVLRLDWRTKYACENYAGGDGAKKTGWGFFTWFILM